MNNRKKELNGTHFGASKSNSSMTTLAIDTPLKKLLMSISIFQGAVGLKGELGAPGIPGEKVCGSDP